MGNIVLLDDLTINKIAAGEVIERPASVVKELVENSIDAGAKNIVVEIKNGGKTYIKIVDNGKGIAEDDMLISLERHATSKIRSVDDLEKIYSMGFRGEALASILSISKITIISKTADDTLGIKIIAKAGEILEKDEVGARNWNNYNC
jgi:DNA mismatch repair protein MutL